ncbi:Lipocalin-like domain-containing protein [Salegentibacter holothuriorum]|uniref:Lipocalin-like domain-containing protein n=1 Tax=Salegentibacter holothuriorum TaxID=241145 RepID=A0A1T5DER9_9FLAO|nr:lipocalin family protein [Salegentibacter holothuriorum]SKB70185.1 Lipocalin-like domain-containing protein [Salegentibacter holothuriorum]
MKKLFLMLFSIALLTSCSEDDDINNDERIYGKWFVSNANLPGGESFTFELSDCNKRSNITFKGNETTYSEYHAETGGECELEDTTESTWSRDNDKYTFEIPVENIGKVSGRVEFQQDAKRFVFSPDAFPGVSIIFTRAPEFEE